MTTLTATQLRQDLFDLLKDTVGKHKVLRIQHREGNAVLLSEEDYDSLIETLELLSIPGFRESMKRSMQQVKKGRTFSYEEVFGKKP